MLSAQMKPSLRILEDHSLCAEALGVPLAKGSSNLEIAGISEATVRVHVSSTKAATTSDVESE